MKPFKSGKNIANWLLRIALMALVYHLYSITLSTLVIKNPSFLIAVAIIIFVILLILGGLISKSGMTIISGLAIAIISTYKIVVSFNGIIDHFLILQFITLSIGFYFFTNGNDN